MAVQASVQICFGVLRHGFARHWALTYFHRRTAGLARCRHWEGMTGSVGLLLAVGMGPVAGRWLIADIFGSVNFSYQGSRGFPIAEMAPRVGVISSYS